MTEPLQIRLYDTHAREKRVFEPIDPRNVRLYVCGPTVYDRAHIGNARPVIVFDVLFRLLRHAYGPEHVTYVRNITDVDDKINARAAETLQKGETLNQAIRRITDITAGWYQDDMAALGALRPTHQPRATEHIPGMVALCERLIENGSAYAAEGHVLFSVSSFDGYGQLAKRSLEDMQAGARVEVAPYKRDPMDFVLWKPSSDEEPGWESPWGRGRPGWHIECSAMSEALLGETFDIHGGGIDLAFPHHENERAQSLCGNPGSHFANYWLHNGFVQVEGEKMSKSLGNFITVEDLRGRFQGRVIRLAMLMTHYRQPFDWTETLAQEARTLYDRWYNFVQQGTPIKHVPQDARGPDQQVLEALADDLNTPRAIARLHEMVRSVREGRELRPDIVRAQFFDSAQILGIHLDLDLGVHDAVSLAFEQVEAIERLLAERKEARKNKNFARSDEIRDGLIAAGIVVKDTPKGVEWTIGPEFDAVKLAELEQ